MHKLGPGDNLCHPPDYIFKPAAIETVGPHNASALNFPSKVGRRLTSFLEIQARPHFCCSASQRSYSASTLLIIYGFI